MINYLRSLQLSPVSYWLGFITGILFTWVLIRLRNYLPILIRSIRRKFIDVRENFSLGNEVRLRNDIYRYAQKQHIAASLFSLDEIVIEPKILTPLIQSVSSIDAGLTDSVSLAIPYTPDWPELAAIYNASTMNIVDALQGNANIILAGHPGSGKTVTLAWLSAIIARNDKGLGKLAGLLPIYVHATDLPHILDKPDKTSNNSETPGLQLGESLPLSRSSDIKKGNEVVDLLIQAIAKYVSPITQNRLTNTIYSAIDNQRAILLLDRVDELSPTQARIITDYLSILLEKYPLLRVIVSMSYDDLAGLPSLGFSLLGMAAWSESDRTKLLQRWSLQWSKWIAQDEKSHSKYLNSYFLKSWLITNNSLLSTLEYTLKVWAGFCGDILGADGPSAIEAYIRRMTRNSANHRTALAHFALQLLVEMNVGSDPGDPGYLISQYKNEIKSQTLPVTNENKGQEPSAAIKVPQIKKISDVESLANNGFLQAYSGSIFGYSHPIISGFLAGTALAEIGVINQFQNQASWVGKNIAFYYFARNGDVKSLIQHYLQEDDLLHSNQLLISRWLQAAPKNRDWRTLILRTLTSTLQKERDTISLSAKVISAMAFSGDAGVSIYFRQLLKSGHQNLKQLAALGCGVLGDKNAVEDLSLILQEQSPASIRSASLGLAAIGDKRSLENLAATLLNGSDLARRCAAEALANNPSEGYPSLTEGSSMEDLMVRRSVIYGLIRIDQPWARKIVENLQLEDNEWVVRNAAIEAFDELQKKTRYAPSRMEDLTETRWLVDYAVRNGTTVAPGKPVEELMKKALISGTQDEKLLALDFYRNKCDRNSVELVYNTYNNNSGEIRYSAYYILWLMVLSGIQLPFSSE